MRFIFCLFSLFNFYSVTAGETIRPLIWQVGFHKFKTEKPSEWYPATVPGAVQLDYAKAKGWGNHMWAENWKEYRWMEDVFWTYRTTIKNPVLAGDDRLLFISRGIDYNFEIILNGEKIFAQEGMFKYVDLNLTEKLMPENTLEVVIFPIPKIPGRPDDRNQAAQSAKPAVSYGWDWHPRLVPSGIWDETGLVVRKEAWLSEVYMNYELSADFTKADILLEVTGNQVNDKTRSHNDKTVKKSGFGFGMLVTIDY